MSNHNNYDPNSFVYNVGSSVSVCGKMQYTFDETEFQYFSITNNYLDNPIIWITGNTTNTPNFV